LSRWLIIQLARFGDLIQTASILAATVSPEDKSRRLQVSPLPVQEILL